MAEAILTFNGKTLSGNSGLFTITTQDPPAPTVEIGDRTYPTGTIGNQESTE